MNAQALRHRRRFGFLSVFLWGAALALSLLSNLLAPCVAQPVQPTPHLVLSLDFARSSADAVMTSADAAKATLTTLPFEVVAGSSRSLRGDSRTSNTEWNEFFHSRDDLFAPYGGQRDGYRVSFDYRVIARTGDTTFYTLFRQTGHGDTVGWTEWRGEPGATGHIETRFAPHDAAHFFWIIGVHGKGAVAIDHLRIVTDPALRSPDLPQPIRTWKSSGNTTYYVDAIGGADTNTGKSSAQAWRSLDRVNAGTFAGGDSIRLKAGGVWAGYLSPGGSGVANAPIIVERYGVGANPRVDAGGKYLATLFLQNTEQIEVHDLDIANRAPLRYPGLAGALVREEDFGTAHHVVLRGLVVHDVLGSDDKAAGGGSGIRCTNGGKTPTCYDDLRIENCHLTRTDRNGIDINGNWMRDATWFPSRHVVIRGNLLEDIGGDGIVPIGCDGALIERNELRGGRMRAEDYAAGIWPWGCDNTTIQFNRVSGMHGTKDGEAYDSDYNCRNSLFQYNYSHDNDGGFMLICTDGAQHLPYNIGNTGTVIRYNLSVNDGLHTFNITGPCRDIAIYNNTFSIGPDQKLKIIATDNWGGGWTTDTRFTNNLFYVRGAASFDLGGMTGVVFDHNAFWGSFTARPTDAHALLTDPELTAPGDTHAAGIVAPYRPAPNSPLRHAGVGGLPGVALDFAGAPIPLTTDVTIGAYQ